MVCNFLCSLLLFVDFMDIKCFYLIFNTFFLSCLNTNFYLRHNYHDVWHLKFESCDMYVIHFIKLQD